MFLKIRFSPTCFSSGNQVISWAVAENNSVIVEFLLPSSFGGHHSKAFLRQIGKKILLLSSQLLTYSDLVSGLHQSHCPLYMYPKSRTLLPAGLLRSAGGSAPAWQQLRSLPLHGSTSSSSVLFLEEPGLCFWGCRASGSPARGS